MFEVLVYMFENYIDSQFRPDDRTLSRELSAAGFEQEDINGAFDWFKQLESSAQKPELFHEQHSANIRIFTEQERNKIASESLAFLTFLTNAKILNTGMRELIIDLAMSLPEAEVGIEEMRWIVLMTTWGASKTGPDKTKEYLFIEDVLLNNEKPTLH